MKKVIALICISLAACATSMDGKGQWKCEAANMSNAHYDGGDYAYIHLHGYPHGRSYQVVKKSNLLVIGTTREGIPFSCTLQK